MARRGYHSVEGALDPETGDRKNLYVAVRKVDKAQRYGHGVRLYSLIHNVPEVVRDPVLVLEGLGREAMEEGLCYVGRPAFFYRATGEGYRRPESYVFLVFVDKEDRIYTWRRERGSGDDNELLEELMKDRRFGRCLWQRRA